MTHYSMTTITGTCFFCPKTFFFKEFTCIIVNKICLDSILINRNITSRWHFLFTLISRLRKRHRVVLFLLLPAFDVYKRLLEIRNDFYDHNDIWCRIAHKALNSYDENSNVYWCFRQNHSQFTRNVQESADPENFSSERFFIHSMHILVNLQCE